MSSRKLQLSSSSSSSSSSKSSFGPLQIGGIFEQISVARVMETFGFTFSVCTLDNLMALSWVPALLRFSRIKQRKAD